jgi:hypothetical protein
MWECDYPHSDSTWPHAPELLAKRLSGVSDDVVNKITYENALRILDFDPFASIPKDQATVGVLRARADSVDTSFTAPRRASSGELAHTAAGLVGTFGSLGSPSEPST